MTEQPHIDLYSSADICDEQSLGECRNIVAGRATPDAERAYRCRATKEDRARTLLAVTGSDGRHGRADPSRTH